VCVFGVDGGRCVLAGCGPPRSVLPDALSPRASRHSKAGGGRVKVHAGGSQSKKEYVHAACRAGLSVHEQSEWRCDVMHGYRRARTVRTANTRNSKAPSGVMAIVFTSVSTSRLPLAAPVASSPRPRLCFNDVAALGHDGREGSSPHTHVRFAGSNTEQQEAAHRTFVRLTGRLASEMECPKERASSIGHLYSQ
jgi:hypothetical protein